VGTYVRIKQRLVQHLKSAALKHATNCFVAVIDGDDDLLLAETVFDSLNARAALFAIVASIDGTVVR